jgi:nucleoid-associated protein YgaU
MAPGIEGPSAPPAVGAPPEAKKDLYDEDWHPQRDGDTYVLISKEYYKTADYAQALEAYNKDRRKPGERIIRVPPTWVLEEQFPNLVGKADKADKTDSAEPKATGVKFEPATPPAGSGRPAPPPAATGTDEYKVTAEAGETIREIARKALGDPNGWKKLWDLNPGLDPTQPIPAGTTLRLPR